MLLKFISRITFLHSLASIFVNLVPFFVMHNFSKYYALRKSLQIIKMDKIKGDYCEFGCFTGASLNHVLRITSKDSFLKEKTKQQYGSFDNWYESDNGFIYSYLVDYKMGIRICNNDEELPEDDDYGYFYFHVVDQKKCLWARLKYEI